MANQNKGNRRSKSYNSKAKRHIRKAAKKQPVLFAVLALVVFAAAFIWYYFTQRPAPGPVDGTIEIHTIDVGQADAILLSGKEGFMLIDTGENKNTSRDALVSYLDGMGVKTIEWLVLTHPDADHIGGAERVFEEYKVKRLLLSDRVPTTAVYASAIAAAIEEECEIYVVETDSTLSTDTDDIDAAIWHAGDDFTFSLMNFTVLGPFETKDNNNSSVVLRMQYGSTVALFMGDAEKEEEEQILSHFSRNELNCDVLKVGHHGSDSSSTVAFLSASTPAVALISCGEGNKFGHPHSITLEKLEDASARIYRTDLLGSIVLVSDGETYSVKESK